MDEIPESRMFGNVLEKSAVCVYRTFYSDSGRLALCLASLYCAKNLTMQRT